MHSEENTEVSMGGDKSSKASASDGDQLSKNKNLSDSSSSSSSEDERGIASPPPNKRRRASRKYSYKQVQTCSDPRLDTVIQQVSYISQYLTQIPQIMTNASQVVQTPSSEPIPSTSGQEFLNRPTELSGQNNKLALGEIETEFDNKKIIPLANKERLEELARLQQFDTPAWQGIRYKKALQSSLAQPGFIGLKINEELCHFNKSKDYLASTEQLLAGLSNSILEQRQLLKTGLQDLVDWASENSNNLNFNTLFDKITNLFGPGSATYKNLETTMQIICGKRAECIEVRRDRILKEISNINLKTTLQKIPPSREYLFSREALQPVIASLGGSQMWLNTPNYLKDKRSVPSYQISKKVPRSSYKAHRPEKRQNTKFRKDQPFRQHSTPGNKSNNTNNKQI